MLISRIARTPVPEREAAADAASVPATTHPIREGLRWLRHNPPVRTLVLIILVFNVTWAAPWSILVLYATEHLGMGPVGYGAPHHGLRARRPRRHRGLRLALREARLVLDAHARV